PPPLRHRTTTGPGLYRELRQHGSRWDGWDARGARLLRGLVGLVREAGAAGGTARFPGGSEGHLVQVAIAHEADEDAAGVVIPGNARDHGYLHGRVRASGFGVGLLVPLVLLSLVAVRAGGSGGGGGGDDKSQLGFGRWVGRRR